MKINLRGELEPAKVWIDDRPLLPGKSQKIFNHSPEGFAWGYGGSGPAQLALAILLRVTDEATAVWNHQDFKWDFISRLPQSDFDVEVDISPWMSIRRRQPEEGFAV